MEELQVAVVPGMPMDPLLQTVPLVGQADRTVPMTMLMVAAKLVLMAKTMQEPLVELKQIRVPEELMQQTLPRIEAEISQPPKQPSRPLRTQIRMPIGQLATTLLANRLVKVHSEKLGSEPI
jgi:hypothetical protein